MSIKLTAPCVVPINILSDRSTCKATCHPGLDLTLFGYQVLPFAIYYIPLSEGQN